MMTRETVERIVLTAIEELNRDLPPDSRLSLAPDTALYGRNSSLGSLALVNLIVGIEERLADEFGKAVTLADDKAFAQKNSPFASIASLIDYILGL